MNSFPPRRKSINDIAVAGNLSLDCIALCSERAGTVEALCTLCCSEHLLGKDTTQWTHVQKILQNQAHTIGCRLLVRLLVRPPPQPKAIRRIAWCSACCFAVVTSRVVAGTWSCILPIWRAGFVAKGERRFRGMHGITGIICSRPWCLLSCMATIEMHVAVMTRCSLCGALPGMACTRQS